MFTHAFEGSHGREEINSTMQKNSLEGIGVGFQCRLRLFKVEKGKQGALGDREFSLSFHCNRIWLDHGRRGEKE